MHTTNCGSILELTQNDALYLGYELKLSATERKILEYLLESGENFSRPEQIASIGDEVGALTVHISSINRKARALSGRLLIECRAKEGYRINIFA